MANITKAAKEDVERNKRKDEMTTKKQIAKAKTDTVPVVQISQSQAMMNMIESASVNPDVDINKLEKLMAMFKESQEEEKKREFNSSMVFTQRNIPQIEKSGYNKQTKSEYSDLRDVIRACTPIHTANGIALSFSEEDSPKEAHIRVVCVIRHSNGYSESVYIDQPLDMAGIQGSVNKTPTHAKGSSFTYGRRYLMGLIFNLAFGIDDDGNAVDEPVHELINEKQAKELLDALDKSEKTLVEVLEYAEAKSVAEIQIRKFHNIMKGIVDNEKKEEKDGDE